MQDMFCGREKKTFLVTHAFMIKIVLTNDILVRPENQVHVILIR